MRKLAIASTISAAFLVAACGETAPAPLEGEWTLVEDRSQVSFSSVKASQVTEVHEFTGLSGSVSETGEASVAIDLASVETNIDIRNERMREMLFNLAEFPQARATALVDPAQFTALGVGEEVTIASDLTLDLNGNSRTIPTEFVVTRIGEGLVKVETANPVVVDAATYGLGAGITALMEVANLDSITEQVPVSASLVFERGE